jgi:hypothetical protein
MPEEDILSNIWEFLNEIFAGYCACYETSCGIKKSPEKTTDAGENPGSPSEKTTGFKVPQSNLNKSSARETVDVPLRDAVDQFIYVMRLLRDTRQCTLVVRQRNLDSMCQMFMNCNLIKASSFRGLSHPIYTFNDTRGNFLRWKTILQPHSTDGINCYCQPLQRARVELNQKLREVIDNLNSSEPASCRNRAYVKFIPLEQEDIHELAHALFWYFRKGVVDIILKNIAAKRDAGRNCTAMSVGSTRITSDYDITVSGYCAKQLLSDFEAIFVNNFYVTSDYAFDTNIYGSMLLLMQRPDENQSKMYTETNCSMFPEFKQLTWVLSDPDANNRGSSANQVPSFVLSQYAWAFLKLRRALDPEQHKLHSYLYNDNTDLSNIINAILPRENGDEDQESVYGTPATSRRSSQVKGGASNLSTSQSIQGINALLEKWDPMLLQDFSRDKQSEILDSRAKTLQYNRLAFESVAQALDYPQLLEAITRINSEGNEMYYTRAAIVDVVHNQQACPSGQIKLTVDDYMQSAIEQYADWIAHHHKEKYLKRLYMALEHVVDNTVPQKQVIDTLRLIHMQHKKDGHIYDKDIDFIHRVMYHFNRRIIWSIGNLLTTKPKQVSISKY